MPGRTTTPGDPARPPAVVVGLDSMQGIQAARILRSHGIPVIAIAADPDHHCCRTNSCRQILFADTGTAELVRTLRELASTRSDRPVLVPCQDKSVRVISRHRNELEDHFRFVLPPAEVVDLLADKIAFYDHARAHGLPVPETFVLRTRADAVDAADRLSFPSLLKPSFRTVTWDRHTTRQVFKVESPEELIERYDTCNGWADSMIAQQWIAGGDSSLFSCNCYFSARGEPLVTFVARKLRQWPPRAGASCLGEEVRDDVVRDTTLALFQSVPYRGLGYVEMKQDTRTGDYFIIEPNIGRPTGRSAIAEAGGVALLYTMYCDAAGLPLPPNRTQTFRGAKWIDLRHDFQSALYYWRRGELTVGQWLRSWRGRKAHAIFSWRDPRPFLADLRSALGSLVRARTRPRARSSAAEPPGNAIG